MGQQLCSDQSQDQEQSPWLDTTVDTSGFEQLEGNQCQNDRLQGDQSQPSTLDALMAAEGPDAGDRDQGAGSTPSTMDPFSTITAEQKGGGDPGGVQAAGKPTVNSDPWTERVEALQQAHGKIDGLVGGLQGQAKSALGSTQRSLTAVQGEISQWAHNEAHFLNDSYAHSLLKSFPGPNHVSDGISLGSLLNMASNATPLTKLLVGGGLVIVGAFVRKSREEDLRQKAAFLKSRHKTVSQMGLKLHKSTSLSNAEAMMAFLDNAVDVNDITWRGGMLAGAKPFFGTTIGLLSSSKKSKANPDSEVSKRVLAQADMALDMYKNLGPALKRDRAKLPRFGPSILGKATTFMSTAIGGYVKSLSGGKPLGLSGSVEWKSSDPEKLKVDSKLTSIGSTKMADVSKQTKSFVNKNLKTVLKKHSMNAAFDGTVTSTPAPKAPTCDRVVSDSSTRQGECHYRSPPTTPTHKGTVSMLLGGVGPEYNATGDTAWASIDLTDSVKSSLLYNGITKGS